MADDRLLAALDRIETALGQLERPAPSDDRQALEARHNRLRVAVCDTLAGLDRLLEQEG